MASTAALYTPEVLGLAVALAEFPLDDSLPLRGTARSPSCGSSLELGLSCVDGRIERVGLSASACAIGQASAALFARAARGLTRAEIQRAETAMAAWLAASARGEEAPLPDWPGLSAIAAVAAYPGRHGAILLAWRAALAALAAAGEERDQ